jgi:hypothetical protein
MPACQRMLGGEEMFLECNFMSHTVRVRFRVRFRVRIRVRVRVRVRGRVRARRVPNKTLED